MNGHHIQIVGRVEVQRINVDISTVSGLMSQLFLGQATNLSAFPRKSMVVEFMTRTDTNLTLYGRTKSKCILVLRPLQFEIRVSPVAHRIVSGKEITAGSTIV